MKKRFFCTLLILCSLSMIARAQQNSDFEQVDELISQNKVDEARSLIDTQYPGGSDDYEVLWRLSRLELLQGEQASDEDEELAHYERALEYADAAVKANKDGSLGYIRRAAANGKLALFQGVLTANSYVNSVRDDCERAIKNDADGDYHLATAYYILGRTHLKLTETPVVLRMPLDLDWGNIDEAVEYLEKSVELRPDFIMYQLDYARALIEYDDEKKAKELLREIADMDFQEPGDDLRKEEAAELLGSL